MNYLKSLTAPVLLLSSSLCAAVEISILPSATTVQQGNTVSVDLVASDLGSFAAPSLGAFLAEIVFDDAILDFDSAVYGSLLGDPSDPLATSIATTTGVGSVSLDEFSFLFDFELDALQPDSFTLATLTFRGQAAGVSALAIGTVDLSDAVGNTLTPTAIKAGSIQVTSANGVPAPATVALILPFALLLAGRTRRSR
jgi:hypothetical protein